MKRLALVLIAFGSIAFAQQPQTQTAPLYAVNAKYTNGVAPGYAPTAGTGLNLALGPGTANCSGTIRNYAGGTLALTANTTNYVYLDTGANCAPAVKTATFTATDIPVATVVAGASTITSIADDRTFFVTPSSPGTSLILQHNSTPLTDQSTLNFLDNGTIAPDAGYTLAKFIPNSSGGMAAEVPSSASGSGTLGYIPLWTPNGTTLGNSHLDDGITTSGTITSSEPFASNTVTAHTWPAIFKNTATDPNVVFGGLSMCPNITSSTISGCSFNVGMTSGTSDDLDLSLNFIYHGATAGQNRGGLGMSHSTSGDWSAIEWDWNRNVYLPTLTSQTCLGTDGSGKIITGTCTSSSFPSGTTNQLLYYASAGTTLTPLTLGTNLSITGGTLNANGSGGGGAPGPYSYTFTVSGTLTLIGGSAGSGYSGTATCTLVGGQLISGTADTCTATLSSGAVQYALVGSGVYSVPPRFTFSGFTGGTGAVAPAVGLGTETVNAYSNQTQSSTPAFTGSDAASVFNQVTAALQQTGGTLYFKPGWYNCNTPTRQTGSYTNVYYCFGLPASGNGYNTPIFKIQGESSMSTNFGVGTSGGGATFYVTSAAVTASGASGGTNVIAGFWANPNSVGWVLPPWTGMNVGAHVQINNVQILFPDNTVPNERAIMMLASSFTGVDSVSAGFAAYPTALGATHDIGFETNGADSDGAVLTNNYAEPGWDIGFAINTEHTILTNPIAEENTTGIEYGFENGVNNQSIIHSSVFIHPILGEDVNAITFGTAISAGASLSILEPDFETSGTAPWTTSSLITGSASVSGTITDWLCHTINGGTCPSTSNPYSVFTSGSSVNWTISQNGVAATSTATGPEVQAMATGTGSNNPIFAQCSNIASGNSCYLRIQSGTGLTGSDFGYKLGNTFPGFITVDGDNQDVIEWNSTSVNIPAGNLTIPGGNITVGGSGAGIQYPLLGTGNVSFGTVIGLDNTSAGGGGQWYFGPTGSSSFASGFLFSNNQDWPLALWSNSATAAKVMTMSGGDYMWSTSASGGIANTNQNAGMTSPASGIISMDSTTSGNSLAQVKLASVVPGILYSAAATPLPACGASIKGMLAVVSDATSPTYMGSYTSGGGVTAAVICSYNGTTYSWLTH